MKARTIAMALFLTSSLSYADQRIFAIKEWLQVPDQTRVAPFLNAKDCTSSLPYDLLDGFSLAAGEIDSASLIHIMPP